MSVKKVVEGNQRSIVAEFEFDASPETVWAALSDPNEIARWFCLHARVEGKVGSEIEFNWDPLFDFKWVDQITIWEPNKRLAFAPTAETVAKEGLAYVCDFVISTDKGKTKLKMVQSGFTTDAKWDEELESFFGGWNYELYSLWHYLTYHRGERRDVVWARLNFAELNIENPFKRLTESTTLFEGTSLRDLKVGDRYKVKLSDTDIVEGIVVQIEPYGMDEFAGTIENMNNGLFRIGAGKRFCFTWLALYSADPERTAHLESLLRTKFNNAIGSNE